MRILLSIFAFLTMTCGVRATMDSHQYTEVYARKLQELYPQVRVTIDGDLALTVKVGDSYSAQHWLNNSFAEYQSAPETFDAIVTRYGKAALPKDGRHLVKSEIVPVVKDSDWLRETDESVKAIYGKEVDYVKEDICDGLVVLYARDTGDAITYLHADEIKGMNLSPESLRALSLENLKGKLLKIERHESNGVYFYTAGGTYEASLILFSWMWSKENFGLEGDVVFAVPSRDVLAATSSKNAEGIARIRAMVSKLFTENPSYRLTRRLFRIANGKIRPLEDSLKVVTP